MKIAASGFSAIRLDVQAVYLWIAFGWESSSRNQRRKLRTLLRGGCHEEGTLSAALEGNCASMIPYIM